MARSISIDHIGFTNMKRGTDSIIVKYDETKSDKTGERCTNKNVYANPTDPSICFFTALGIYCSYESVSLSTREGIFLKENAKLGTAAHRFCNSLQKLIENYAEVVDGYVRSTHTNTHGIRKGSATYSTSGTTVPPSLISVALRGEWSMGKVFDVYFNFGECGDNYLGRILAGLDPNSTNFGDLPPYFKKDMNDDVIKQGMTCMYGDLLKSHPNSVSILLLCFASVIYHIEFIKEVIDKNPGHIFSTLPLLQDEELLQKLKRLITREPSAMMKVTGVPPHIMQLKILDSIKTRLEDITSQFTQQSGQIIQTVRDAIFANDLQSGTLNLATLENKLNEHTNSVEKIIEKVFETRGFNQSTTMAQQVIETGSRQELFSYDNRFYAVPKGFQFPKNMKLKQAWLCWRQGFPYYRQKENDKIKIVSIKPFRQIKPTLLPKKVQIQFRNDLKPILCLMEQSPHLKTSDGTLIDMDLESSFTCGLEYVKENIEYIFANRKWVNWTASYFCKKIKYSSIMQYGTENDKLRANRQKTHHNKKRRRPGSP